MLIQTNEAIAVLSFSNIYFMGVFSLRNVCACIAAVCFDEITKLCELCTCIMFSSLIAVLIRVVCWLELKACIPRLFMCFVVILPVVKMPLLIMKNQ